MKTAKKAKCAATLGALALGIGLTAGCTNSTPGTLANEYSAKPEMTQNMEQISELEGKILKVQPSTISFTKWLGNATTASNHEFEYMIVESKDKKIHTLIYPYSKAILEREATIKYRPLSSGMIDSETFIDTFLIKEYYTNDNIVIEAEGIITKDGIRYK